MGWLSYLQAGAECSPCSLVGTKPRVGESMGKVEIQNIQAIATPASTLRGLRKHGGAIERKGAGRGGGWSWESD